MGNATEITLEQARDMIGMQMRQQHQPGPGVILAQQCGQALLGRQSDRRQPAVKAFGEGPGRGEEGRAIAGVEEDIARHRMPEQHRPG